MDILYFLSYKPQINRTVKNYSYLLNFTVQLNLLIVKFFHRTVELIKSSRHLQVLTHGVGTRGRLTYLFFSNKNTKQEHIKLISDHPSALAIRCIILFGFLKFYDYLNLPFQYFMYDL